MTEKKCPHCYTELPFNQAIYCDLCGQPLPKIPTVSTVKKWVPIDISVVDNTISNDQIPQKIVCSNCQFENIGAANYCSSCGTNLG